MLFALSSRKTTSILADESSSEEEPKATARKPPKTRRIPSKRPGVPVKMELEVRKENVEFVKENSEENSGPQTPTSPSASSHNSLPLDNWTPSSEASNLTSEEGPVTDQDCEHTKIKMDDSGHESLSEKEEKQSSVQQVDLPNPQCWLMRLFQSKLFDMSIAIHYLFNSKEPAVQIYLGNKLFVS